MDDHKKPSDAQAPQKTGPDELGSAATGAEPVTRAQDGAATGTPAAGPATGDIQWLPMPPPSPPPPLKPVPSELWRDFFNLTGGSLLYCLSALFITFGIAKMLVPLLVEPETVRAALPCLSALNVYELALLGTLLFIVLRENVTDDAISLVVLVALFMVGSGIALTCVSGTEPRPALLIGALALALAAGKLVSLRACVGLALRGPLFVGLLALVAWNFLVGPLLAQRHASVIVTKAVWQVSWLVLLASGALALSGSVWRPARVAAPSAACGCETGGAPFLRREPMAVIVALILWCAAVVHQRVLGMVFDIHMLAGDYLPAVSVALLLGLRLSLSLRRRMGVLETILALVPLLVCLAMLDPSCMTVARGSWPGALWHPPVLLAITAAAIGAMCWRMRCMRLYIVAAAYALGVFLTWGFDPALKDSINEKPVAAIVVGLPFVYSLVRRQLAVSIACASIGVYASFGAGVFDCLHAVHASTPFTTALGVWGAAMLIIAWRCKEKAPAAVRVLGALALMICAFGGLPSGQSVTWLDAGFAAATTAACAAVWLCFRHILPAVLLGLPALVRAWVVTERCAGWRYVALSFLLLFAGAAVSVRKAHRRARAASEAARADG